MSDQFTLKSFRWYSWQMMPGYLDYPYFSPIYIKRIIPKKTGKNILALEFVNALYAAGVKGFEMRMKVIKRTPYYLILDLGYAERSAIISEINFNWIENFTPHLLKRGTNNKIPPPFKSDIQKYLSAFFTGNPEQHIQDRLNAERNL